MKSTKSTYAHYVRIAAAGLLLSGCIARSQGTFIYDQQSATSDTYTGSAYAPVTENQPFGQSFTPTLPTIGFIRLFLGQGVPVDPGPATFYVNLRANSMTGPVLAASQQTTLNPGFVGSADFLFTTPVAVTPGSTYYLQPIVQVGGIWGAPTLGNVYQGGTIYGLGTANPNEDLWFREGILVPEPSTATLAVVAAAVLLLRRKRMK